MDPLIPLSIKAYGLGEYKPEERFKSYPAFHFWSKQRGEVLGGCGSRLSGAAKRPTQAGSQ